MINRKRRKKRNHSPKSSITKIRVIALGFLLILVSAVIGYLLIKVIKPVEKTESKRQQIDNLLTSSINTQQVLRWQTYINKTYGYQFNFPPQMYVDTNFPHSEKQLVVRFIDQSYQEKILIKEEKEFLSTRRKYTILEPSVSISVLSETIDAKQYAQNPQNAVYNGKKLIFDQRVINGELVYIFDYPYYKNTWQAVILLKDVNNKLIQYHFDYPLKTPQFKSIFEFILPTLKSAE